VGQKQPNAFGLYDMLGNMNQWCQDWYGENYYINSPSKDPKGPSSGTERVVRGGSHAEPAEGARSAHRSRNAPAEPFFLFGFRLVREATF